MSTLDVQRAASLWYPVMLAQASGELSEARAAELLGLNLSDYRNHKELAIKTVSLLANTLSSPLRSVVEPIQDRPESSEAAPEPSGPQGGST